ncbi:M3 family oligoendopeptidase [Aquihabitans sp. G128]|uniref:M3 family oligoendopeptidase n=1 Tax=Aquihabitans sp. G128 TaxID=2849779 RepID=UPI001C233FC8|nr:M3 family oligoendopeptidase [Aquihabitans sp. G128]QXC62959.1 M3 family oligoendopeptidase [Aquihabitans sp. G128]
MTVTDETTATEPTGGLPRWDVSGFFPSLGSRELAAHTEQVFAEIGRLRARFDELGIRGGEAGPVTEAEVAVVDEVVPAFNRLFRDMRKVGSYLYAHTSTDARDDDAAGALSRYQAGTASFATLDTRFDAWLARWDLAEVVRRSTTAADHAYALERGATAARHQMSEAEEGLAAELALTGGRAWAKLHADLTSRLTATVDGEVLPMSMVRGLATDPDPARRKAAYDAELEAWDTVAVPLATAINAFKGEANTLNRRRGWTDSLDPALERNGVDRYTLAAMQEAVEASLPDWHRYLQAKARLLGHEGGLPWWDLIAPVGTPRRFAWPEATAAVRDAFATYSPRLAGLVDTAVADAWIDAEPRSGKVGGAFCMSVTDGVSRVLLNFDGSFDSVQTLAHELGHAYHNVNLGDRTPMQRDTPMALAETASIFCETIMVQAGLAAVGDDAGARLALLDGDLAGACQVVVDIHSRFLFERALSSEREQGVLSIDRLRTLMLEAQATAYGPGVDPDARHRDMWAVKGHYFTAYYNWPYTFGLLFGIGLYAEFQRDPERFRSGYDDLLSATGLGDAPSLAARFGIDVRDVAFWTASLDVLRARIDEFVEAAEG